MSTGAKWVLDQRWSGLALALTFGLAAACGGDTYSTGGDAAGNTNGQSDGTVSGDGTVPDCGASDLDGDGYGIGCAAGADCDETDPSVHFGAPEVCGDGVDNNCNQTVDDGCAGVACEDQDGDGWPAGADCAVEDCDDANPDRYPGAVEFCNGLDDNCDGEVDEGVLNACGDCSSGCTTDGLGTGPFPLHPDDPEHVENDGVGLDPNGDIILDSGSVNFNFLWISNTSDLGPGTVSKVDTVAMTEVGRYFSVTCFGNPAYQNGQCLDTAGGTVQTTANSPSRTAVDYNFDVWVANRAFGGQASTTKIANSLADCIDRNGDGVIQTSSDVDGDGSITTDCDADGVPDSAATNCTNGMVQPEFYGLDDECVLFTANYGTPNSLGRSVALDAGDPYSGGAGNAWVGTCREASGANEIFKVDGTTGMLVDLDPATPGVQGISIPAPLACIYGLAVDGHGVVWATDYRGYLAWVFTNGTYGGMLTNPYLPPAWCTHYGIAVDGEQNIWLAACSRDKGAYRYRPDRTTPSTLSQGSWTQITLSRGVHSRGIAIDLRGYVWIAHTDGYISRLPQTLPDGSYDGEAAGYPLFYTTGTGTVGVGVDFTGHIWGINNAETGLGVGSCTRIEVDAAGDPTGQVDSVLVGTAPYTYSDFTGFGLRNFTRPQGTYTYLVEGCAAPEDTRWDRIEWSSTEPSGTAINVRVRTADDTTAFGLWSDPWDTTPAVIELPPQGPVTPNPAQFLQVQFELTSIDQTDTPILHDFQVVFHCLGGPG